VRTLWVVGDANPRPRRLAVNANGPILSPAWSPDGRQLAYIGGRYAAGRGPCPAHSACFVMITEAGTVVYAADVATGKQRVILNGNQQMAPCCGLLNSVHWLGHDED
jgi:Tol biopolymer transport system component